MNGDERVSDGLSWKSFLWDFEGGLIIEGWKTSIFIPLYEYKDRKYRMEFKKYRCISILKLTRKINTRVLVDRVCQRDGDQMMMRSGA